MNFWDELKKFFASTSKREGGDESEKGAEMAESSMKAMTMEECAAMSPEECNEYMKNVMGFTPRMFQTINTVTPVPGKTFADFYASVFGDGALSKKIKELMFMAGGVSYCSPRCIIHVVPAIEAGATTEEIFEAASVGMILAGFVPGGPGIPYAFEYAVKCLDIEAKHRKGEPWEYLPEPKWDHGIY